MHDWRRRADSNRRIEVLQTPALPAWLRRRGDRGPVDDESPCRTRPLSTEDAEGYEATPGASTNRVPRARIASHVAFRDANRAGSSSRPGRGDRQKAANEQAYDLIIMDIEMPIMNGIDACISIKNTEGPNQGTPIIAMTASVLDEDRARIMEAGMQGMVGKPVRLQQLTQELDKLFIH